MSRSFVLAAVGMVWMLGFGCATSAAPDTDVSEVVARRDAGGDGAHATVDAAGLDCVSGTADGCKGYDRVWNGTQCCIPQGFKCVAGTAEECGPHWANGPEELWTGTACCVDLRYAGVAPKIQCAPGTEYYCEGNYNTWTGTECCVYGAVSCVPLATPPHGCSGSIQENTGTHCCSR